MREQDNNRFAFTVPSYASALTQSRETLSLLGGLISLAGEDWSPTSDDAEALDFLLCCCAGAMEEGEETIKKNERLLSAIKAEGYLKVSPTGETLILRQGAKAATSEFYPVDFEAPLNQASYPKVDTAV